MSSFYFLFLFCSGSTANGVAGLDSMHFNHEGKAVCQAVDRMAEQVQEGSDGDRE